MTDSEFIARLNDMFEETFGREPHWNYFQRRRGPMFFWTIERYDKDADTRFAGMYVSGVYQPVGKGSRSGKATRFAIASETLGGHQLRREAKARALRLFRKWESEQPTRS